MNHREPTSAPSFGAGSALPCLALLLLPLMAVARAWGRPGQPVEMGMTPLKPYLAVLGAPPLRFEETVQPPPDLTTRPAASAPPYPHGQDRLAVGPASIPGTAADNAPVTVTPPASAVLPPSAAPASPVASPGVGASTSEPAVVVPRTPAPILPDETRPQVRPEDFLPYFQIPASQPGDPNVIVPVPRGAPAPAPLPPSSATYTQTPR